MALGKADIKSGYPLPVYNYRVTIADEAGAPSVSFSEVTGLSVEYEPVIYKHGLSFAMGSIIMPGMRQPIRITLRKGIVKGNDYLLRWLEKTYNDPPFGDKDKRDVIIDLCDESATAVVRWTVKKAFPVKHQAPDFNADSNDVAIESVELIAEGLTADYHP
ncbi:MAG: phage tail protein [Gammaproteobacteria bacterium]